MRKIALALTAVASLISTSFAFADSSYLNNYQSAKISAASHSLSASSHSLVPKKNFGASGTLIWVFNASFRNIVVSIPNSSFMPVQLPPGDHTYITNYNYYGNTAVLISDYARPAIAQWVCYQSVIVDFDEVESSQDLPSVYNKYC